MFFKETAIRYHLNINPDDLTENQFIEAWVGLEWILEQQQDRLKK